MLTECQYWMPMAIRFEAGRRASPIHSSSARASRTQTRINGIRLHIEFQAAETINHFGDPNNSFGAINQFWIDLHKEVDNNVNHDDVIIAWLKNFVGGDHDPMAVVVGVPSIDCCDHPHLNT